MRPSAVSRSAWLSACEYVRRSLSRASKKTFQPGALGSATAPGRDQLSRIDAIVFSTPLLLVGAVAAACAEFGFPTPDEISIPAAIVAITRRCIRSLHQVFTPAPSDQQITLSSRCGQ